MRRWGALVIIMLNSQGCVGQAPEVKPDFADSGCAAVASQRARDAAVNGVGSGLQSSIQQRAYESCVVWKQKAGGEGLY